LKFERISNKFIYEYNHKNPMPDPFQEPKKEQKFSKVMKAVFLTRFSTNLLYIILVMAVTVAAYELLRPNNDLLSGNAVAPLDCPVCQNFTETVCEEQACETDCDLCPIKTKVEEKEIIRYSCPDGTLVDNLDDCEQTFPAVDEESSGTVEGITLAIDNIELERDTDTSGFVTRVDYTIINRGEFPIVPKIEVKVYEEWTLKVKQSVANKEIFPEVVVNPNEYVQRKDRVRIYFNGEEQTLRLLLVDQLPMIDRDILAVTKDFTLD
jgi:hypothetical protein